MQLYHQTEDLIVMGLQVKTFPDGIKEAFGSLMKTFGSNRAYYGVSWMDENDNILYYATAGEVYQDERKHYDYELLRIEKGEYRAEAIYEWRYKTDCIKDVFHKLMGSSKPDKNNPCIEWYKSDEEMLCMIKTI